MNDDACGGSPQPEAARRWRAAGAAWEEVTTEPWAFVDGGSPSPARKGRRDAPRHSSDASQHDALTTVRHDAAGAWTVHADRGELELAWDSVVDLRSLLCVVTAEGCGCAGDARRGVEPRWAHSAVGVQFLRDGLVRHALLRLRAREQLADFVAALLRAAAGGGGGGGGFGNVRAAYSLAGLAALRHHCEGDASRRRVGTAPHDAAGAAAAHAALLWRCGQREVAWSDAGAAVGDERRPATLVLAPGCLLGLEAAVAPRGGGGGGGCGGHRLSFLVAVEDVETVMWDPDRRTLLLSAAEAPLLLTASSERSRHNLHSALFSLYWEATLRPLPSMIGECGGVSLCGSPDGSTSSGADDDYGGYAPLTPPTASPQPKEATPPFAVEETRRRRSGSQRVVWEQPREQQQQLFAPAARPGEEEAGVEAEEPSRYGGGQRLLAASSSSSLSPEARRVKEAAAAGVVAQLEAEVARKTRLLAEAKEREAARRDVLARLVADVHAVERECEGWEEAAADARRLDSFADLIAAREHARREKTAREGVAAAEVCGRAWLAARFTRASALAIIAQRQLTVDALREQLRRRGVASEPPPLPAFAAPMQAPTPTTQAQAQQQQQQQQHPSFHSDTFLSPFSHHSLSDGGSDRSLALAAVAPTGIVPHLMCPADELLGAPRMPMFVDPDTPVTSDTPSAAATATPVQPRPHLQPPSAAAATPPSPAPPSAGSLTPASRGWSATSGPSSESQTPTMSSADDATDGCSGLNDTCRQLPPAAAAVVAAQGGSPETPVQVSSAARQGSLGLPPTPASVVQQRRGGGGGSEVSEREAGSSGGVSGGGGGGGGGACASPAEQAKEARLDNMVRLAHDVVNSAFSCRAAAAGLTPVRGAFSQVFVCVGVLFCRRVDSFLPFSPPCSNTKAHARKHTQTQPMLHPRSCSPRARTLTPASKATTPRPGSFAHSLTPIPYQKRQQRACEGPRAASTERYYRRSQSKGRATSPR